jgi:hypothetical protein
MKPLESRVWSDLWRYVILVFTNCVPLHSTATNMAILWNSEVKLMSEILKCQQINCNVSCIPFIKFCIITTTLTLLPPPLRTPSPLLLLLLLLLYYCYYYYHHHHHYYHSTTTTTTADLILPLLLPLLLLLILILILIHVLCQVQALQSS